jgi:hypothetical protein
MISNDFNDLYKKDKSFKSLVDDIIVLGKRYMLLTDLIDSNFDKSEESINSMKLGDVQKFFKNVEPFIKESISHEANRLILTYIKGDS